MRVMAIIKLDTAKSSEAVASGDLGKIMGKFMERAKPESSYFGISGGVRTCFFVMDMKESSQMGAFFEDFFGKLSADISLNPIMNLDDLRASMAAMAHG